MTHAHNLGGGEHSQTIVQPTITINGQRLSDEQMATLSRAVTNFKATMGSWCLAHDELLAHQANCAALDALWWGHGLQHTHQTLGPGLHAHTGVHCHGSQGHWGWTPGA